MLNINLVIIFLVFFKLTHTQVVIEPETSHTEESLHMRIRHWDVPEVTIRFYYDLVNIDKTICI